MEREKLTDICFVFRILEFEVNFCDFICAAYIVCSSETWTLTTNDENNLRIFKDRY